MAKSRMEDFYYLLKDEIIKDVIYNPDIDELIIETKNTEIKIKKEIVLEDNEFGVKIVISKNVKEELQF